MSSGSLCHLSLGDTIRGVGFFDLFRRAAVPAGRMSAPPAAGRFSVFVPPEMLEAMGGGGLIARPISRQEALQVPAVARARNLICGSLGSLPIRVHAPDLSLAQGQFLVPRPDPDIPHSVVMAQTIEDLLFEGVAWWRVTARRADGFPVEAQHVPINSVNVVPTGIRPSRQLVSPDVHIPIDGDVYIDGIRQRDIDVIRFDSPNPPLLVHAARAIRICLLLDSTAAMYANESVPLGYFTPRDPNAEEAPDDEIEQTLDDFQAARKEHAYAYVPGALDFKTAGLNPEQLQLASARQHAVLEIARATGIDPEELGVSTTSRTYSNQVQRWQALINLTFGAYVSAVQDRLSMRDVVPPGFTSRIDFSGFNRGDEQTRMDTYKTGLEVGAYADEDEVRAAEGKPKLTPAQRAARSARTAPATPNGAPNMSVSDVAEMVVELAKLRDDVERLRQPQGAHFEVGTSETVRVQFEAPAAQDFQVDTGRRTITGLLLPWGKVANNGFAKWRFTEGSVSWNAEQVSRIKLNLHHDSTDLIGVATRVQSGSRGLMGTFKVGRGAEGDRALEKAEDGILDGFSVEVDFDSADSWQPDPTDESVRLVRQSTLRAVALTGIPAFDDARLTSVKASRDNGKESTMTAPAKAAAGQQDAPGSFDLETFATGLKDAVTETHKQLTTSLGESIGDSITAGVKAALENLPNPQGGPEPVRAARFTVTREAPVYPLDGLGPSLVRDAWYAAREHDGEALDRLRKFRMQTEDMAKLAAQVARFGSDGLQKFTTVTTGNASAIIPPGYRPDLFVPMLAQARPLVNAASRGTIANASPFVVPVFGSFTGATADHVEGTNPTDGSLTLTTKTVTPGAISGRLVLTREIVDSSNPAIDQIALNSMMESYNRQTEGKMYTLLNGASGAGGVITAGFVPSGAQAIQSASGAATALPVDIRKALALYPFRRFASPSAALMGQVPTSALASVLGTDNRPLFPSVGAQNASGVGNAVSQGWFIDGLAFVPAWAISGVVGANDTHVFIFNSLDVWAWESPLLTFRYEEKSGPALIELALFGYFGAHVLRPVGLSGIRMTAA